MKKIGIFYGAETTKTALVGKKISEIFGEIKTEIIPVEEASSKDFEAYDYLIIGVATWFDGELPSYWDEILPILKNMQLKGKKVAIFGLGDQANYPDNFADGVGILAEIFEKNGAILTGFTSTEGYHFNQSLAIKKHQFSGLILDFENQTDQTEKRINDWVEQLKKEFIL